MNLDKRYFVDRASIIKELIQEKYLKVYCCCKYNSEKFCLKYEFMLGSVVGKNEEFKEIHRYYTTREKNPLKKMQLLVAGRNYFQIHAGKDLEMIFLFQSFLCFNISKTFWALHRKKRQRCCIRNSSIVYDYADKNDGDSC